MEPVRGEHAGRRRTSHCSLNSTSLNSSVSSSTGERNGAIRAVRAIRADIDKVCADTRSARGETGSGGGGGTTRGARYDARASHLPV